MARKLITCPETAHLEEIELENTRHGVLIAACSRFEPRCEVACTRECARRMDARERRDAEDRAERVLIVYADRRYTRAFADALAGKLQRDAMVVEQADAERGPPPPPDDYDAVVIGSTYRFGHHARSIRWYVAAHRVSLAAMPTFLYVLGPRRAANIMGWHPGHVVRIPRVPWYVRWSGDPIVRREAIVDGLAQAVAEQTPCVV